MDGIKVQGYSKLLPVPHFECSPKNVLSKQYFIFLFLQSMLNDNAWPKQFEQYMLRAETVKMPWTAMGEMIADFRESLLIRLNSFETDFQTRVRSACSRMSSTST